MPQPRDPFKLSKDKHDQHTEMSWGAGQFPDPRIDFSDGGRKSGFPIADPDRNEQLRTLREIKRTDLNDPLAKPSPYVAGNMDRYGAGPPIVRETKWPKYAPTPQEPPPRMERQE
jgi:hypothetical protein